MTPKKGADGAGPSGVRRKRSDLASPGAGGQPLASSSPSTRRRLAKSSDKVKAIAVEEATPKKKLRFADEHP